MKMKEKSELSGFSISADVLRIIFAGVRVTEVKAMTVIVNVPVVLGLSVDITRVYRISVWSSIQNSNRPSSVRVSMVISSEFLLNSGSNVSA